MVGPLISYPPYKLEDNIFNCNSSLVVEHYSGSSADLHLDIYVYIYIYIYIIIIIIRLPTLLNSAQYT